MCNTSIQPARVCCWPHVPGDLEEDFFLAMNPAVPSEKLRHVQKRKGKLTAKFCNRFGRGGSFGLSGVKHWKGRLKALVGDTYQIGGSCVVNGFLKRGSRKRLKSCTLMLWPISTSSTAQASLSRTSPHGTSLGFPNYICKSWVRRLERV